MKKSPAFTLVELLVVIAIIGILAALLLPALSRGKQKAWQVVCQNNIRQVQLGWGMYANEFGDNLPHNSCGVGAGQTLANPGWVAGDMWLNSDYGQDLTECTNTGFLVGSQYVPYGSIGGYVKNPAVYHCPADTSFVTIGGQDYPRVRSLSMNNYMGAQELPVYRYFMKKQQIIAPGPSDAWVFIDENANSINDGLFAVDVASQYAILDYPAVYHNSGSSISFADGHTEFHKWLEPTTRLPLAANQHPPGGSKPTSANDRDMAWLVSHTTSRQ